MDLDSARAEVEKLFDESYSYLVRYGRRLCGDQALVEDSVQQVMLLLFRELRKSSLIPNTKAWALLVLKREILRHLRRDRIHVVLDDFPIPVPESAGYLGISAPLDRTDSFLSQLSPREAEVLLLRKVRKNRFKCRATTALNELQPSFDTRHLLSVVDALAASAHSGRGNGVRGDRRVEESPPEAAFAVSEELREWREALEPA